MDIILLQDIEHLGDKHEVVTVKDGYGRNYLIPQRLALVANKSNMGRLDELKRQESAREEQRLDEYKAIAEKLEGTTIKIGAKSGTSEKIFGSVTNVQLAAAMKEQLEVEVDRKKIEIQDEVKTLGTYTANVNLHPEVQAKVQFEVVSE